MTQTAYQTDKAVLEAVQRLPTEEQKAILTMLRGAVIISDLYVQQAADQASA